MKPAAAEFEGTVLDVRRNHCKVRLDAGRELLAFLAGRLMKNSIRIVAGDRVTVEVSEYDTDRGHCRLDSRPFPTLPRIRVRFAPVFAGE